MSDTKAETPKENPSTGKQMAKLAFEIGPVAVFFIANSTSGIFVATGAFMAATIVSLAASYAVMRTIPVMPLVTAGFVMTFGALTLILQDETFIKIKPTLTNLLFAAILGGGLLFRQLFLKLVFQSAFQVTDDGWRILTRYWMGFFVFLALLNEVIWRNFSTDFWVSFKVFGIMPLTIVFSLALLPIMLKHEIKTDETEDTA